MFFDRIESWMFERRARDAEDLARRIEWEFGDMIVGPEEVTAGDMVRRLKARAANLRSGDHPLSARPSRQPQEEPEGSGPFGF